MMRINRTHLKFSTAIILLFAIQTCLYSCPKCNQDFYNELLGNRANTLGGHELLEAIKNQSVSGQTSNLNLPSSINSLTDVQQSNTQDTSEITDPIGKDNNQSKTPTDFLPYIIILAKIFFFGKLLT